MPYSSFKHCQQQLADIEAIDFFLAKRLLAAIEYDVTQSDIDNGLQLNQAEKSIFFHLIIALSHALNSGHSCLQLSLIAETCCWQQSEKIKIETDLEQIFQGFTFPSESTLNELVSKLPLTPCQKNPLVFEAGRLYLKRYYQFECEVATHVTTMRDKLSEIKSIDAAKVVASLFNETAPETPDRQKAAVANALNKKLSIIVGGPGTGKTTTVAKLLIAIQALSSKPLNIKLAAPTGKAAQRLSESLSASAKRIAASNSLPNDISKSLAQPAATIHRLLGVIPNSPNFRHNKENPLDLDVLLIDEVSMLDLPMMARVMRALPDHARLILLGDAQQLPSVAAGSILADLAPLNGQYSNANSSYIESVTQEAAPNFVHHATNLTDNFICDHLAQLNFSHRFKGDGGIGLLAEAIIKGDTHSTKQIIDESHGELTNISHSSLDSIVKAAAIEHYLPLTQATTLEQAFLLLSQFRILTAMRAGEQGIEAINDAIESVIHQQHNRKTTPYFHGKPIMITSNLYDLGLYNGDIGIIWQLPSKPLLVAFETGDHEEPFRFISLSRINHFESVYAMTIHKTQGSEFKRVTLLLPEQDSALLSRELLYTGVTRAKQHLSLWAKSDILETTVSRQIIRQSGLKDRIFKL